LEIAGDWIFLITLKHIGFDDPFGILNHVISVDLNNSGYFITNFIASNRLSLVDELLKVMTYMTYDI